jgi:hypothetical protein
MSRHPCLGRGDCCGCDRVRIPDLAQGLDAVRPPLTLGAACLSRDLAAPQRSALRPCRTRPGRSTRDRNGSPVRSTQSSVDAAASRCWMTPSASTRHQSDSSPSRSPAGRAAYLRHDCCLYARGRRHLLSKPDRCPVRTPTAHEGSRLRRRSAVSGAVRLREVHELADVGTG